VICTHCWASKIKPFKDVSKYWNNPKGDSYVCSKECYDELMQTLKDKTWMFWNPKQRKNLLERSASDGLRN